MSKSTSYDGIPGSKVIMTATGGISSEAPEIKHTHDGVLAQVADVKRTGSVCKDIIVNFGSAIRASLVDRYLLANIVYCIYACAMLYIDYDAYPRYEDAVNNPPALSALDMDVEGTSTSTSGGSSTSSYYNPAADAIYQTILDTYYWSAVLHVLNSLMYFWVWLPSGFRWYHPVMYPEYLNMIGAGIYMKTATMYKDAVEYESDFTMRVHRLETAAAAIEVIAAFGWFMSWWLTYPRGIKGRGWTLDDPDVWAISFIVIPSFVYLAYNIQILHAPTEYGSNYLYVTGDLLYAIGAFFYLFASMRDDGWFWFMPAGGALPYGMDTKQPIDFPEADNSSALKYIAGNCLGCGVPSCSRKADYSSVKTGESSSLMGGAV